jgi:hypothetical protein
MHAIRLLMVTSEADLLRAPCDGAVTKRWQGLICNVPSLIPIRPMRARDHAPANGRFTAESEEAAEAALAAEKAAAGFC